MDKEGLIGAQTAKARGLVTDVAYEADVLNKLRELTGTKAKDKPFPQVSLARIRPGKPRPPRPKNTRARTRSPLSMQKA